MLNWPAVRLLLLFLLAVGAWADSKYQMFSDFTTPLPLHAGGTLVLGIVGGWNDGTRLSEEFAAPLSSFAGCVYPESGWRRSRTIEWSWRTT